MSPLNITQPLGIWSINVYNGYYKVMSNIPKMGHLPTPVESIWKQWPEKALILGSSLHGNVEGNKNKPKPYPVLQQLPRPMNFASWVTPYHNLTDAYWLPQNLHFPSTHRCLPKTSTTQVVSKTTSPLCGPWSFVEHWKLNPGRRLPIRKPSRVVSQIVATLSCPDLSLQTWVN